MSISLPSVWIWVRTKKICALSVVELHNWHSQSGFKLLVEVFPLFHVVNWSQSTTRMCVTCAQLGCVPLVFSLAADMLNVLLILRFLSRHGVIVLFLFAFVCRALFSVSYYLLSHPEIQELFSRALKLCSAPCSYRVEKLTDHWCIQILLIWNIIHTDSTFPLHRSSTTWLGSTPLDSTQFGSSLIDKLVPSIVCLNHSSVCL